MIKYILIKYIIIKYIILSIKAIIFKNFYFAIISLSKFYLLRKISSIIFAIKYY